MGLSKSVIGDANGARISSRQMQQKNRRFFYKKNLLSLYAKPEKYGKMEEEKYARQKRPRGTEEIGRGTGRTKKQAEQAAALAAVRRMGDK